MIKRLIVEKSLAMQKRGAEIIPGLTQLLSKRPDQFAPGSWPGYYDRAKGVEVWDLDGNCYIDMSISGIGAVILGYCDPEVDEAVNNAVKKGNFCSLNCPEEVELADLLCQLHPWANKVRFARTGGESMAVAVRIARAYTGRDKVAFCGYHGWHDWYIAANLLGKNAVDGHWLSGLDPVGVPKALKGTAHPFHYNEIAELKAVVSKHRDDLAAIIMEPIRNVQPQPGFLEAVRQIADETGAVLIMDEISSGFRLCTGGAHLNLGITPDIAVFSKALGNGYPIAAIIGIEQVMEAAQSCVISSTYWTDRIGPAAALATIKKYDRENVAAHLNHIGALIQKGWLAAAKKADLKIKVFGMYPMSHLEFEGKNGMAMMTLFVQGMLERGFLASNRFYANYSHTEQHVNLYLKAVDDVFAIIAKALQEGNVEKYLRGPVAKPGFSRLA
ncbi:MAG: aminotransferase class III-fold pyridoxal phosphate-dependent enzyme [Pseudomonadota bacterium]